MKEKKIHGRKQRKKVSFLQSHGEIIKKLLWIIKEKRHNFNNKIWVALILKLLKLQKLGIQETLLPTKNYKSKQKPNIPKQEEQNKDKRKTRFLLTDLYI